jgi:N-acetylneuraminic acid mutarotase
MAYDAQSDRIIKFVGLRQSCTVFNGLGETWAYDTNTNTWENMHPTESPFGLIGARMVYDSESDRMILFGGLDAKSFSAIPDVWAYDYETNSWKNMHPAGDPPGVDNFLAMSYDVSADRIIAWGCAAGTIGVYDYNSNTWESKDTKIYPSYCDYNAMVYDPGTGLNILFGGTKRSDESPTNETWGYDYSSNSWKSLSVKNPPSARGWHAMVYDSAAGVMVLFGGGESRDKFTDEVWVYNPVSGEWSNIIVSP